MKKILLLLFCLLLFGCSNKTMPEVESNVQITEQAKELSNELRIDFNKLDLDVSIIDANKTSFTLYLSREVSDEDAVKDIKKICDFIKTFSKKEKLYDFYNPNNEFDYSAINEQTKTLMLKATIKSKDYKVAINRMNGLSYKGSEETYSIYKINFLEYDFNN